MTNTPDPIVCKERGLPGTFLHCRFRHAYAVGGCMPSHGWWSEVNIDGQTFDFRPEYFTFERRTEKQTVNTFTLGS
eukprot:93095-Amphidinium_carterae.1